MTELETLRAQLSEKEAEIARLKAENEQHRLRGRAFAGGAPDFQGGEMSDPRYLRNDIHSLLAHVTEECGEVLAAIGKTLRWGIDSVNPELPPDQQEANRDWVLRELCDLELTIARLRVGLAAQPRPADQPAGKE